MRRSSSLMTGLLGLISLTAITRAGDVTIGQRLLHVADGFEVELVAGPPLVERPISVSTDVQGHLYVTDSGGMSEKAEKQLAAKPHRIRRLTDTNGDGVYDQSALFADKLMFPEGCLWHDGSLYVAAPPQIWKLTDADGDGIAEKREAWFDGKTLTGCGNDLHGPYLGRDGWFYWCKGAFAEQRYTLPSGREMSTRAGHIFRARPDGSKLEPVLTGGMDNPVGVAFLSTGERILSCTFLQQPADGKRDGLIHAIYGGVYGKVHDVLRGHVMTGDVMPVLSHQGAAAPSGIIAGSAQLLGGGFQDRVLACYFNLHKVVLHELIPDGATFKTHDTDLLSCDHPDFHPTDVYEDADGSLLIVDTGGWYKICCPTSVLARPDVLGGIYRLRKKGAPAVPDPRGNLINWTDLKSTELAKLLADNRPAVRQRAVGLLRKAGAESVAAIVTGPLKHRESIARTEAVWALAGIDAPAARQATAGAIRDEASAVRRAAIASAGLWRESAALPDLLPLLKSPDQAVVRAAAEAIGRLGDAEAVPALLAASRQLVATPDMDSAGAPASAPQRVLEHSLIYALIEIGDADATLRGLTLASPTVRRVMLVALDGMTNRNLKASQVVPLLSDPDLSLSRTASWVVGHHPEWGTDLVAHFRGRLAHLPEAEAARSDLASQLSRLSSAKPVEDLLTESARPTASPASQWVALRAIAESGRAPAAWLDAIADLLSSKEALVRAQAIATSRAIPIPKGGHTALQAALRVTGSDRGLPAADRINALLAAGPMPQMPDDLLADLSTLALPDQPTMVRSGAVAILGRATLKPQQYNALADLAGKVGPLDLPRLLPAFERAPTTDALGAKLVSNLKSSVGRRGLRADLLRPILARFPQSARDDAADLLKDLNVSAAEQAARLDKLVAELPPGDMGRGQAVFIGKKAGCINCHTIGYNGGRLGPDLTQIGKVRTPRDLLEAIVYPSASFVRGYDPVIVELRDGDKLAGIITTESQDQVTLATGPQETRRIDRKAIADIRPSSLSLMPDGMEAVLSTQELADVVAFLKLGQK